MPNIPLHPAIVHVPLGLAVVIPLVAAGLVVANWRGLLPRRSWLVVIGLQLVMLGVGGFALQTGERDEDRAEQVVPESAIETHEERAQVFMIGGGIALAAALLVLLLKKDAAVRWAATGATVATVVVAGLAIRTGQTGGEVVYGHGLSPISGSPASGGGRNSDGDDD